jgi:hypothetical protein
MIVDRTAYAAGMLGAAAMSAAAAAGRRAGINVELEMMMGTMVRSPGSQAWLLGLAGQIATGGVLAQGYRLMFEELGIRPTAAAGAALGLLHGGVAGAALAAAPLAHPRMPEEVDPPGAFMRRAGGREAALFLGVHVLFGAIVASCLSRSRHPTRRH